MPNFPTQDGIVSLTIEETQELGAWVREEGDAAVVDWVNAAVAGGEDPPSKEVAEALCALLRRKLAELQPSGSRAALERLAKHVCRAH